MRILLVGSGGREHALAQALAASPTCRELHCAPGNPGIARVATCHDVAVDDVGGLVALAHQLEAELVVIGPELPLVLGLGDALRRARIPVFGPSSGAALVEGSKAFSKKLMLAAGVPTARALTCTDVESARRAVDELGGACVVKADGLAAGKGVAVCPDRASALAAIEACLVGGAFGEAGRTVVVEELLVGDEVSLLALCSRPGGAAARRRAGLQAHRRRRHRARTPAAWAPTRRCRGSTTPRRRRPRGSCTSRCWPSSRAAASRSRAASTPGLMLTADGPRVLEYNVRFGDPETQALVARLDGDLAAALAAIAHGAPDEVDLGVRDDAAVTLVLAAPGYPEAPRTGQPIEGIERAEALAGVSVQHAGTALRDGRLVVAGGRVLGVTATAPTLHLARERAMAGALEIEFDGKQVRSDIALRAAQEEARV